MTDSCIEFKNIIDVCIHGINKRLVDCDRCSLEHRFIQLESEIKIHEKKFSDVIDLMVKSESVLEDDVIRIERKIERLESLSDFEKLESLIFHGAETHASILRCEAKIKELENKPEPIFTSDMQRDVTHLLNRVHALEKSNRKIPYKCPVCDGIGKLPHPLNSWPICPCNTCEGKGIVLG